jgi:Domain of unknown function (DUF4180)
LFNIGQDGDPERASEHELLAWRELLLTALTRWIRGDSISSVPSPMSLSVVEEEGVAIVEGRPDEPVMVHAQDAARVVEACLSARARCALLYPANLPPAFFDLSSGEAGEILQKLESFGIRFAVVCPPGSVRFSSRFHEALGRSFQVFETRGAACDWLGGRKTR